MSRILQRTALATLALASAAALAAPAAQAQSATKPGPCTDFTIKDPKGDQVEWPTPGAGLNATTTPGPDSVDARGVFFNYKPGADGKPVLTANMQVTNLVTALPEGAQTGSVSYFIDFAPALGDVSWVEAITDGETWTFNYGKVQTIGVLNVTQSAETTGKAFEGPDGVLEIVVPSAAAKPGAKIEGIAASISYDLYPPSDDAPDEGTKTYTITECPAAAGAPAPSPDPAPAAGPPPPAPQPNAGPSQPSGTLPLTGPLTVSVAADSGKRSTARKRGMRARIRCSVQCNVSAVAKIDKRTARKLKLGRKALTIGKGRATITKAGRIPFYVKLTSKTKKALARKGVRKFAVKISFSVTDRKGGQLKRVTKKVTLR